MVILGGDLNMHPDDLGTRLLRNYTGLQDSFSEAANFDVSTCYVSRNDCVCDKVNSLSNL